MDISWVILETPPPLSFASGFWRASQGHATVHNSNSNQHPQLGQRTTNISNLSPGVNLLQWHIRYHAIPVPPCEVNANVGQRAMPGDVTPTDPAQCEWLMATSTTGGNYVKGNAPEKTVEQVILTAEVAIVNNMPIMPPAATPTTEGI